MFRDGADRLVLLSMHPFGQNFLVKEQRTAVFNVLNREMKEIVNRDSGNRTYVAKKRPISFDLHEINDLGQRESYVRVGTLDFMAIFSYNKAYIVLKGYYKVFETLTKF